MPTTTPTLPQITLKNRTVPLSVLQLIPLQTTEKYQVAAFEQTDTSLKLAIVHPEALKEGFYIALRDLGKKIGKEIELFKTDPGSMAKLLKQYKQGKSGIPSVIIEQKTEVRPTPQPVVPAPKPPLFELGKTVSVNYLKKVPLVFSQVNRLACVDFLAPDRYWFITDTAHEASARKALDFIERENSIKAYLMVVEKKELEDLLRHYELVSKAQPASQQPEKPKEPPKIGSKEEISDEEVARYRVATSASANGERPVAPSKDVVMPDVQATILSSEEAKSGLAGFFQKVAQNFAVEKDAPTASPNAPLPPPLPSEAKASAPTAPAPSPTQAAPAPITIESVAAAPGPAPKETKPATPQDADEADVGKLLDKSVDTSDELKVHIKSGFIPRIVAAVVSYAIHEKASDIHIEAFEDEVRIRYRIDGQLIDVVKLPPDIHAAMVSRIKILSKLRLDETRVPQDGRFDVSLKDAQVDLRVSVMPTVHGEKVVMRILDKSKGVASLEALGIEGLAYQNLTKAINKPYGIVLATGPTGSGKSTSLYAVLNRIATPNVNVVTLEDPVEYEVKGINQSQIRPKIGYTFAEGLRSILRQDPNIIMVGEIRDGETATMATQAALTGHLVLSTLHTNDAAGAIPRLTNMGIEPFLIASSLNIAMGQRLVRRICPHCKSEITLPDSIKGKIQADIEQIAKQSPLDASRIKEPYKFYQGTGCDQCGGKGYQGRIGIYEVLIMSDAVEDLTLKHASASDIQVQAQKEGMITMYQDGLLKVISGVTTLDEVLRETTNK